MIKSVVFDMDGVLFDTERAGLSAWDYAGEKLGIENASQNVRLVIGMARPEICAFLKNKYGEDFDFDLFYDISYEYAKEKYDKYGVPKKEGLFEILDYLKSNGYKIALASSSFRRSVYHHLDDAGITDYFDAIICGDMIKKSKPDPDIYLTACRELAVSPEETFAVEDSKAGLWSAHDAGCKVIMIPDLFEADSETEKIIFKKFESLLTFKEYLKTQNN